MFVQLGDVDVVGMVADSGYCATRLSSIYFCAIILSVAGVGTIFLHKFLTICPCNAVCNIVNVNLKIRIYTLKWIIYVTFGKL